MVFIVNIFPGYMLIMITLVYEVNTQIFTNFDLNASISWQEILVGHVREAPVTQATFISLFLHYILTISYEFIFLNNLFKVVLFIQIAVYQTTKFKMPLTKGKFGIAKKLS